MANVLRCLGIVLLIVLFVPGTAIAHTDSVETNPAQGAALAKLPPVATITFSEKPKQVDVVLAKPGGGVAVLAPDLDGSTVKIALPAHGPRGEYRLSYRVVSADGHPVSGSVKFTVTTGPEAVATAAREPADPGVSGLAMAGGAVSIAIIAGFLFWLTRR